MILARFLKYLCLASNLAVQWFTSGPNLEHTATNKITCTNHETATYSSIKWGMCIMECIFKVIGTPGYNSLKVVWWSLISDSKYPNSSFVIRLANKISMMSKRHKKFSQCLLPCGILWPIANGRNLPKVHICMAIYYKKSIQGVFSEGSHVIISQLYHVDWGLNQQYLPSHH